MDKVAPCMGGLARRGNAHMDSGDRLLACEVAMKPDEFYSYQYGGIGPDSSSLKAVDLALTEEW